jgi:hypothetical protein
MADFVVPPPPSVEVASNMDMHNASNDAAVTMSLTSALRESGGSIPWDIAFSCGKRLASGGVRE